MKAKKPYGLMVSLVILSLTVVLTGCGKQQVVEQPINNTPPINQNENQESMNIVPSEPIQAQSNVMVANNTLGQILTDGNGMTLYIYTKDTKDNSVCYETCAVNWPPLLVTETPKIANNLVSSNFGVITRTNGDKQVTFKGMPLYYWIKDAKAGDTTGENVGGVWFVYKVTSEDLVK